MVVSALVVLRYAAVWLLSLAFAAGCAAVVVRLAVRTRFFADPDFHPETWHGRPVRQSARTEREGLNPFIVGFATFWVAFTVALVALDGPLPA